MNKREDIVARLGGLSRSDRTWILNRLSPTARSALVGASSIAPSAPAPQRVASPIDELDVNAVVAVLASEPAWVSHALLSRRPAWGAEVISRLPVSLSSEIDRLDESKRRYSAALIGVLERELSRAVTDLGPVKSVDSAPEQSLWKRLSGRILIRTSRGAP